MGLEVYFMSDTKRAGIDRKLERPSTARLTKVDKPSTAKLLAGIPRPEPSGG